MVCLSIILLHYKFHVQLQINCILACDKYYSYFISECVWDLLVGEKLPEGLFKINCTAVYIFKVYLIVTSYKFTIDL